MTVLDPGDTVLSEQWPVETPGCEVRPSPDSDSSCGDPAEGNVLCEMAHSSDCHEHWRHRVLLWMCPYHLGLARQGWVVCNACLLPVTVILVA